VSGSPVRALGDLLATLVALLTPAVVSHGAARLWRREGAWLRYAVAVVWCQWVMPPALLAAVVLSGVLVGLGVPDDDAELLGALALLAYALALNCFIARHALDLSRWRTVALVAMVNGGTGALVATPVLLQVLLAAPA
jgi:TRAP-type mannitol/chloroaromatic compound transport system permease large subunit